jgi:hypothetical protein
MSRHVRTILLTLGITAFAALAAEPAPAQPIPKTVPTTIRLNNDGPFLEALEDLLGNPPADRSGMKMKVDYALNVCSAAFNARRYDAGEQHARLAITYCATVDPGKFGTFLSMLHSNLSVYLGKQIPPSPRYSTAIGNSNFLTVTDRCRHSSRWP